jgi:hypothetical protein
VSEETSERKRAAPLRQRFATVTATRPIEAPEPRMTSVKPMRALAIVLIVTGTMLNLGGAAWEAVRLTVGAASGRAESPTGVLVAVGVMLMIFGLVCAFPSVLTDGGDSVSVMRAVVLLLASGFSVLAIKIGWSGGTAPMDPAWKFVLIAALTGKTVQSFAESMGGPPSVRGRLGSPDFKP